MATLRTFVTGQGIVAALVAAIILGAILTAARTASQAADQTTSPATAAGAIVHNVYFSLKEPTPENRRELVANCHKYLSGEPGTVYFAVSTPTEQREADTGSQVVGVRRLDRDFDVGLHTVFKDRAAYDAYQTAARHDEFRSRFKDNWKLVRVFDSDIAPAK